MVERMLIDAAHPEEIRVVALKNNRVEEFDYETANKKQLKGNIYLAKVTRVEPSLQAAFVDYGGNRHGFLAFSEIHPDYYRIPVADREALIAEHARLHAAEQHEANERESLPPQRNRDGGDMSASSGDPFASEQLGGVEQSGATENESSEFDSRGFESSEDGTPSADRPENGENIALDAFEPEPITARTAPRAETDASVGGEDALASAQEPAAGTQTPGQQSPDFAEAETGAAVESTDDAAHEAAQEIAPESGDGGEGQSKPSSVAEAGEQRDEVETLGGSTAQDEVDEGARRRQHFPHRRYKIQEVIKRNQILLVQVVKEERGNKGAALTTYISLAGRYCVLMPNATRGGGISRKITNPKDRRQLKEMIESLEVPEGMSVILRTAGLNRTKPEVKRDLEYLLRAWDQIRETTLQSSAPALIYEEGNLVKRAIRDVYSKDMEEVIVEGEEGYREAKEFVRMLIPSHAKKVQLYRDPTVPLFQRYAVEDQLAAIHSPKVELKSGGTVVFGQTEALVAIDVNSGRATRERNIEETALYTNLEAADEIARQLRLRDLAGLVVIDFIDMEEGRNRQAVERRLKEAIKSDRARIQIGRISAFGLLEMSRQRLRPSLYESSAEICPICSGLGYVRSKESAALHVLREIEREGLRQRSEEIRVFVPNSVALYLLNQKRADVAAVERRHGFLVYIQTDDKLVPPAFRIERVRGIEGGGATRPQDHSSHAHAEARGDSRGEIGDESVSEIGSKTLGQETQEERSGGRRRRGRRGGRRDERRPAHNHEQGRAQDHAVPAEPESLRAAADPDWRKGDPDVEEDRPVDRLGDSSVGETLGERAPGHESGTPVEPPAGGEGGLGEHRGRRRRRGRRGGRRRSRRPFEETGMQGAPGMQPGDSALPAEDHELPPESAPTHDTDTFGYSASKRVEAENRTEMERRVTEDRIMEHRAADRGPTFDVPREISPEPAYEARPPSEARAQESPRTERGISETPPLASPLPAQESAEPPASRSEPAPAPKGPRRSGWWRRA